MPGVRSKPILKLQPTAADTHNTPLLEPRRIHGRNEVPDPQPGNDLLEVIHDGILVVVIVLILILSSEVLLLLWVVQPLSAGNDGRNRASSRDARKFRRCCSY